MSSQKKLSQRIQLCLVSWCFGHNTKQKTPFVRTGFFKDPRPSAKRSEAKGDEPSPKGEHVVPINKKACLFRQASLKKGDDILSHIIAVPSAQAGLTSLFGMGRGEPRRNNHLKVLVVGCQLLVVGFPRTTKDSFNCSRRANILTHWDKEKIILKVLESFFRGFRPGGCT